MLDMIDIIVLVEESKFDEVADKLTELGMVIEDLMRDFSTIIGKLDTSLLYSALQIDGILTLDIDKKIFP